MRTPRAAVFLAGALLAIEGAVGVAMPELFRSLVVWLQTPPAWPATVIVRAAMALLLLAAPPTIRAPNAVRAIGVVTLAGAVAGWFITGVEAWPAGSLWRLPSAALMLAGLVVVWACVERSHK